MLFDEIVWFYVVQTCINIRFDSLEVKYCFLY